MKPLLAILFACAMLVPAPAFAKEMTKAEKMTCQDDSEKFCSDAGSSGSRLLECLAKIKDQISPACQAVVTKHGK